MGTLGAVVCVTGFGVLGAGVLPESLPPPAVDGACGGGGETAATGLAEADSVPVGVTFADGDVSGLEAAGVPAVASAEAVGAECATALVDPPPAHAVTLETTMTTPAHAPTTARSADPLPIKNPSPVLVLLANSRYLRRRSTRRLSTDSGTRPETSPPSEQTSLISEEDKKL